MRSLKPNAQHARLISGLVKKRLKVFLYVLNVLKRFKTGFQFELSIQLKSTNITPNSLLNSASAYKRQVYELFQDQVYYVFPNEYSPLTRKSVPDQLMKEPWP